MTYQVMARKWRPQTFSDLVGQEHIATTIANAIAADRIAHAYLFTGTRGVGKTTSARILAKALNCEKGPSSDPCGQCSNCQNIWRGNSLDVLEIDGASNNGVDDVRELREQVKYAPMEGRYKIYIVDEVHMLTKQAFNALLKTLEEPPKHVIFIFATTEVQKVPDTILSRIQRFDFKRISDLKIKDRLAWICKQESIEGSDDALEAIARKGDGSMRDGLSLFDQVYAFAGKKLDMEAVRIVLGIPPLEHFVTLVEAVSKKDISTCFAQIDSFYQQGIEVGDMLEGFGQFLRDMLAVRQPGLSLEHSGVSETLADTLTGLCPDWRNGDIIRNGKMVSDMLFALKQSSHPRMVVEMGFARMCSLDKVVQLEDLIRGEISNISNQPEPESGLKKKTVN